MATTHLLTAIGRSTSLRFTFVCVALSLFGSTSRAASAPAEVSSSDWGSIRAAYEANRHAAFPIEGGHRARNPGQQWKTKFDGCGFTTQPDKGGWQWGLELRAYGFGDRKRTLEESPEVKAEGQRVTYAWDANVQEWFVNDRRGLEHGFTVAQRPAQLPTLTSQTLTFDLTVRGTLHPDATADGQRINFTDDKGTAMVTYGGLKVWDADGKALPARFEIPSDAAGNSVRVSVDERGARYPLTIDPLAQQAFLTASNAEDGDRFGYAVAVSGETVVVGAPGEDSGVNGDPSDNSAENSGAAYVFVRTGQNWTQQAYLKGSKPMQFDVFGQSVAIYGSIVVVGSHEIDFNTGLTGAAYVFARNGSVWSQEAHLTASNAGVDDKFGHSVSVSGNYALVGAWGKDNEAGAAYVFLRDGTTWSEQAYLQASNTRAGIRFGWAVSISFETAVVGAYAENSNATGVNGNQNDTSANEAGAAYVFVRDGTTWSQQAYLKASNTDAGDRFGAAVSVSGNNLVAGAYRESSAAVGVNGNQDDDTAIFAGAAYVFVRNGATWSQQAYLKASNTEAVDEFGYSVAVSGDADTAVAVVGAHFEDSIFSGVNPPGGNNGASSAGAAYVFTRGLGTTSWNQEAYVKGAGIINACFGEAVAVSAESGVFSSYTVLVGEPFLPFAAGNGTAYIFESTPQGYFSIPASVISFPDVPVGEPETRTLYIFNNGASDLRIDNINLIYFGVPIDLTSTVTKGDGGVVSYPHIIPSGDSTEWLEVTVRWVPASVMKLQDIAAQISVYYGDYTSVHSLTGQSFNSQARALEEVFLGWLYGGLPPASPRRPGAPVTPAGVQTGTLAIDPDASQSLTAEVPAFLGGGSVQLSNFTGSMTISLLPMPNASGRRVIRIDSGSLTAPSVQLPSGLMTGLNRLTFGPPEESGGILLLANGSYTAFATATIVNDRIPDGVTVRGEYSGVYNSQTGKISVQSHSEDLFQKRDRLINISTRMQVLTGDRVLIGGFIITGTDPKQVIIRAIGPSLSSFFPGALTDTTLELFQGNTLLASNDNWRVPSQNEGEVLATGIPPTDDLESALVRTLQPGAYTAIVRGNGGAGGIGLIEAYDLSPEANSKLANISTRGFVDTGDNVMIGGLIAGGGTDGLGATVIVRAIGPSLPLAGVLGDPTLSLHDGNGTLIVFNDNWRDDLAQEAEIIATTIPPTNDFESAIVRDLVPGPYTAIVRGVNGTTGIAVVEAYGLNQQ